MKFLIPNYKSKHLEKDVKARGWLDDESKLIADIDSMKLPEYPVAVIHGVPALFTDVRFTFYQHGFETSDKEGIFIVYEGGCGTFKPVAFLTMEEMETLHHFSIRHDDKGTAATVEDIVWCDHFADLLTTMDIEAMRGDKPESYADVKIGESFRYLGNIKHDNNFTVTDTLEFADKCTISQFIEKYKNYDPTVKLDEIFVISASDYVFNKLFNKH